MTDEARAVLVDAQASRIFPAAVAEVGDHAEARWQFACGTRTFDDPTTVDIGTPFDLASLTKPIATTTVTMSLVEGLRLSLDDRVDQRIREWTGRDRALVTLRDLLEHTSGLSARLPEQPPLGRREFEHDICALPLEYPPRTQSIYSDLGFILLAFVIDDVGSHSLADQFSTLWPDPTLTFTLTASARHRAAPTLPMESDIRRGRLLVGEVHDDYAAVLGGIAGHAGLFGSAPAIGRFARAVLAAARGGAAPSPFSVDLMRTFTSRSTVNGSSRALGWDTMLPTSSCGTKMSAAAFGHVGFTGTSLWIDPVRDRYFILLTNRACGGGSLDDMRGVRRAFHDALGDF